jgi:argininosuccinate lyase
MAKKLWGGRFKKELDPVVKCFSYSLTVDGELLEAEIAVNQAHAKMLARVGLVSAAEGRRLVSALAQIGKKYARKAPHKDPLQPYRNVVEDIHTFVQMELEKKVGALAKKIHTGRSRNDLVVTSTLVYLKGKIPAVDRKIAGFEKALVGFAEKVKEVIVPGLTHLQWAQPVLLAHHLVAYVGMLERDRSRLGDALRRMDTLPLGSAALAGSSLPLDRKFVARELGFSKVSENSLDAVSDRDFVLETLSALSILWTHLSRLAEDFVLWSSEAFGFVVLDDSVATGSSLMPQKKNPDVFELVRGRAGVIFGHLTSLLTLLKGLPLAYNRDLQEDKPALFDAIHKTELALDALRVTVSRAGVAKGINAWTEKEDFLYATDLLEYLVQKGTPFREAHEAVGALVRYAIERKRNLNELSLKEFQHFSLKFDEGVFRLLSPAVSVRRKKTPGSTHPAQVKRQIRIWKNRLRNV